MLSTDFIPGYSIFSEHRIEIERPSDLGSERVGDIPQGGGWAESCPAYVYRVCVKCLSFHALLVAKGVGLATVKSTLYTPGRLAVIYCLVIVKI